jgi:hypothetical protein
VPVQKLLEVVPAPLPVDLAEQALRHARSLDDPEALQHGRLVRHKLPQEELALPDVARAHAPPHARHVAQHVEFEFVRRAGAEINTGGRAQGHTQSANPVARK